MSLLFRISAVLGLLLVIVPPVLYYGATPLPYAGKSAMLLGTLLWFVGSFLGFRQNQSQQALEEEHTPVA